MSNQKYRPVLTAQQISHLISLCKKDLSEESISCISTLSVFEHKIKNNVVSAAYKIEPPKSLAMKLGFEPEDKDTHKTELDTLPETLYAIWLDESSRSTMSINELKAVRTYRYMNDFMSPEEEKKYEEEIMNNVSTKNGY